MRYFPRNIALGFDIVLRHGKMPLTRAITRKIKNTSPARVKKIVRDQKLVVNGALKDIKAGMTIACAANKWDVTKMCLREAMKEKKKVKEKSKEKLKEKRETRRLGRPGINAVLSHEEEAMVESWVVNCCDAGFTVTEDQVLNSIQYLLTELNRETPFPYNRPNRKWLYSFLQRNPQVSQRIFVKLNDASSLMSKELVGSWFEKVTTYLHNINLFDVLKDPDRVFNADEFGFFINPRDDKSLFKRGAQKIFKIINIDQRVHLVVFLTVSASGWVAPPMIISQHSASSKYFESTVPAGWGLGISENGWMTGKTFFEYIANIFNPWLDENKIQKPVILFFNGRTTHLTLQLCQFCNANGILLIGVLPYDMYVVQPLDVAVFSVLRRQWLLQADRVRRASLGILRLSDFCSTVETVINENVTPELIQEGFKKCGLFPWDPSNADYKELAKDFEENEAVIEYEYPRPGATLPEENGAVEPSLKLVLKILEGEIGEEKVRRFYSLKNETNWISVIDQTDIGLFRVWKEIASKAEKAEADWDMENYCEVLIKEEMTEPVIKGNAELLVKELLIKEEPMEVLHKEKMLEDS